MQNAELNKRVVADSNSKDIWLEARMNGVTASDVAGFEKDITEQGLRSLVYKKLNNTFKGNKWTDWGIEREPIILDILGLDQNTNLFRSEEEIRFMATPDSVQIEDDGTVNLIQVKTTSKGWSKIPENYVRQCQWEMYVMGAVSNTLVWEQHDNFIPTDLEPKQEVLLRDDEEISRLVETAKQFLQYLDEYKEGII